MRAQTQLGVGSVVDCRQVALDIAGAGGHRGRTLEDPGEDAVGLVLQGVKRLQHVPRREKRRVIVVVEREQSARHVPAQERHAGAAGKEKGVGDASGACECAGDEIQDKRARVLVRGHRG
jgi:hypothetical protein